jgi:hypothetical protein
MNISNGVDKTNGISAEKIKAYVPPFFLYVKLASNKKKTLFRSSGRPLNKLQGKCWRQTV